MKAQQPLRWIWVVVTLAMLLCLSFLFYEAKTRPAQPTTPKSAPLHDQK
jgi:bacteriorhodopsin